VHDIGFASAKIMFLTIQTDKKLQKYTQNHFFYKKITQK